MAVPAPRVFLSYRREDSRHVAGRLADQLRKRFDVFVDVETIQPGTDFRHALYRAVSDSDVLLALIGPDWSTVRDEAGRRRLDDPQDWVANEILAGLSQRVLVVPVLIDEARIPAVADLPEALSGLVSRQALRLRHESFSEDVERLSAAISQAAADNARRRMTLTAATHDNSRADGRAHETAARSPRWPIVLAAIVLLGILGVAVIVPRVVSRPSVGPAGSSAPSPTRSDTPTETVPSGTPTRPAQADLAFGEDVHFDLYTISVDDARFEVNQGLLVSVRLCINRDADPGKDGKVRARWDPWSVTTTTGGEFRPRLRDAGDPPTDMFPADRFYMPGECVSGRIPFSEVRASDAVREVGYSNLFGNQATWLR